jgi:hypothetical protein
MKTKMKGTLKNTKAGWFVLYQVMRDEITSGYDSIPLHPDSQTWMDGYNLYEGNEVEFEVRVYPSGTRYAKTTPEQVILDDETILVKNIFHQELKKTAMQELIDEIVEHLTYDDDLSEESRITYETIRLRCLGKLSIEKEQMMDAYKEGCFDNILDESTDKIRAEQYYNETYGQ